MNKMQIKYESRTILKTGGGNFSRDQLFTYISLIKNMIVCKNNRYVITQHYIIYKNLRFAILMTIQILLPVYDFKNFG